MVMVNCVSGASPMTPKIRVSTFKTRASVAFKTRASMPFIALFMFFLSTQGEVLATQPPNIVLIVIDDLGKTITNGPIPTFFVFLVSTTV